jgi:ElaB/YqjD/DUF883 family membrane-anchored ribosome-binding protein
MAEGTEPIRQDLDNLRDSMSGTIGEIDNRVRDTIDNTVDNVRQTFDLKRQVREHPWMSVGLALTLGYLVGGMDGDKRSEPQYVQPGQAMRYYPEHGYRPINAYAEDRGGNGDQEADRNRQSQSFASSQYYGQTGQSHSGSGGMGNLISRVASPLADELQTIAIATMHSATRMLRESLQENIPQFNEEYARARGKREHQSERQSEHHPKDDAPSGADPIYDDASSITPGTMR